ncbi:MAG: nitrogen fixation protein [Desulfobulbaceae bacterium]|uniref:Nitrogen fixation protein n=1 Tax=Candidatus Desulfobia pelagia TaxID=2841692 RepID=A0A8J6TH48_9BACT|nr:nitrogen fixation protein [Candidatus Desulfobia pelagia]
MKIAIVSTDGINVDEHFGKAKRFLIYELGKDGVSKLGEIKSPSLSIGDKSHAFDKNRFDSIVEVLKGCSQMYSTKIGEKPRQELEKRGIMPVIYEGAIDAITPTNV